MTSTSSGAQQGPLASSRRRKVLLVDDHPVLRKGVGSLINRESDLQVSAEAETAAQALNLVRSDRFDVVLLDLSLPDQNGLDVAREIFTDFPALPILAFSMCDELRYAERALRAGCRGYIMKNVAPSLLLGALRQVLRGERFLSEQMSSRLGASRELRSGLDELTERELQVFRLLGESRSTRDIAECLGLSMRTVEAYREHIKEKLRLESGAELLNRAFVHVHELVTAQRGAAA